MKRTLCLFATFAVLLSTMSVSTVQATVSHDLAVTSLSPVDGAHVHVSQEQLIKATITNHGSRLERDVEIRFLANGSLHQSKTVAALMSGSTVEAAFLWCPPAEKTYNLTIYVPPVPGETNVTNNAESSLVEAGIWMPDRQVGEGRKPSLATDSNGYLYAAHHQGGYPYGHTIYVSRSTDGGYSWKEFSRWTNHRYPIGNPSIAIDPYDNRVYVAYEREQSDIYCKVYVQGEGWSESVHVTDGRDPSITSEYQYGSANYQYISYEVRYGMNDIDLMVKRSKDHGVTWPDWWCLDGCGWDWNVYTQSQIATAEGKVHVVYRRSTDYYTTGDIRVSIYDRVSNTWTTKSDIDGTSGDCWWPSIAATHGGSLVMVAFTYQSKVLYSYSQFKGSDPWHKGYILDPLTSYQHYPVLAVDGGGNPSNLVKGYVHATFYTGGKILHKKTLWYEPMNWSPSQTVTDSSSYERPTMTTHYRSSEMNYFPCVAFTRYVYPNYQVRHSTVAPLPFNYSLSVSPPSIEVVAGSWTTCTINGSLISGPSQTVHLTLYDLPSGIALTHFTSRWATPGFLSTLIVAVFSDAPGGTYNLTVVGEGGGVTRLAAFSLRVKAKLTLTLSLSATTVARGSKLTISGKLTPGQATTVNLYYRIHGTDSWILASEGSWMLASELPTDPSGAYSVTVTVPTWLTPGDYDLVAVWFDEPLGYAASPIVLLTIT